MKNITISPNNCFILAFVRSAYSRRPSIARLARSIAAYILAQRSVPVLVFIPELSKARLYPIALQACKDVMEQEGTYVALKSNFEDIFNNNGISGDVINAGSESLFEIGYSNNPARGRIMYTFGIKHTTADNMTTMLQGSQVGPTRFPVRRASVRCRHNAYIVC